LTPRSAALVTAPIMISAPRLCALPEFRMTAARLTLVAVRVTVMSSGATERAA
jgi:hypothetical protein